jgi:hypothetical protein
VVWRTDSRVALAYVRFSILNLKQWRGHPVNHAQDQGVIVQKGSGEIDARGSVSDNARNQKLKWKGRAQWRSRMTGFHMKPVAIADYVKFG